MRHGDGGRRLDSAVGERKRTMTLAGVRVIGGLHENPPRAPSRPRAPGAPGPRSGATSPRRTRGSPGKAGPPLRRRRRRSNSNGAAVRHRRRRVHDFKEYSTSERSMLKVLNDNAINAVKYQYVVLLETEYNATIADATTGRSQSRSCSTSWRTTRTTSSWPWPGTRTGWSNSSPTSRG